MSFQLFEHNRIAYETAEQMLRDTGKAAVIHPTGTGKSFIGFKLCLENPNSVICWAAPSDFIYQTQLENLVRAGGTMLQNIRFYTYARLMNMSQAEISLIRPDYIILDEFHRCGAEMWGQGITRLLQTYPNIPVLGLSATAIRYLDNQRNMAEELFGGNIASEITLGEAIVRGILNAPVYVIGMYTYQKELEKYQRKIASEKNPDLRIKAESYLDTLKRMLEMADGVDVLFHKYMKEKDGKYLVFCSGYEHMLEMISHVPEWFAQVDSHPHIYQAYSKDIETGRVFQEFKADNSPHLKLLFCIDMLNEGIHVDDISGVILMRPTVSPIIYKQQIGRALSAKKDRTPYIFDLVANIDGLYSIAEVQEEMQQAIQYYYATGERSSQVMREEFQIHGEIRDCLQLFEQLNDTLTITWEKMYACAKEYFETYGDLSVPISYKTKDGYSLGTWLSSMRNARKGTAKRIITEEQIRLLDEIGMRWESKSDSLWNRNLAELQQYYQQHKNIDVPFNYITDSGVQLGKWLNSLRSYKNADVQNNLLSPDRIAELDAMGMIWDKEDYLWERNLQALKEYRQTNGHPDVPRTYRTEEDILLGEWLYNIRYQYRKNGDSSIEEEKKKQLEDLGITFTPVRSSDKDWYENYREARAYYQSYGNLNVPYGYTTETGFPLGLWIRRHRTNGSGHTGIKVTRERRELLNQIGMIWEVQKKEYSWEEYYNAASAYAEEHGSLKCTGTTLYRGLELGKWLLLQRKNRKRGYLTTERIAKLDALGFDWKLSKERKEALEMGQPETGSNRKNWQRGYLSAKSFFLLHSNLDVTASYITEDGFHLGAWIINQREKYKHHKLTQEQIELLENIGMVWSKNEVLWLKGYEYARAYYQKTGTLDMSTTYVLPDGYRLGQWVYNQKRKYQRRELEGKKVQLLEAIGGF